MKFLTIFCQFSWHLVMKSISSLGRVTVKNAIVPGGHASSRDAAAHLSTSPAPFVMPLDPLALRLREIVDADKPMLSPLPLVLGRAVLARTYKPHSEARAAPRPAYNTPSLACKSHKFFFSSLVSTDEL